MTRLAFDDLYNLAVSVGFPPGDSAVTAAAIAIAESNVPATSPPTGNPEAVGDPTFGGSYGLWQVNHPAHPEYDIESLFDPTYNAKAALAISNGGSNFTPWSTYNSGAYKQYLQVAPSSTPTNPTLQTAGICLAILTVAGATAYYIQNGLPAPLKRAFR